MNLQLQPGLLVAFAIEPRSSVLHFADIQAFTEAAKMTCRRIVGLINNVRGGWVEIMLVRRFHSAERLYMPCVPIAYSGAPIGDLTVFPRLRYEFRVGHLHTLGSTNAYVLTDVLLAARTLQLAECLYGQQCQSASMHIPEQRRRLELVVQKMYAKRAQAPGPAAHLPFIDVWTAFDLADCSPPDALEDELEQLYLIERAKADRDDSAMEEELQRAPSYLTDMPLPLPHETAKTFLHRTFAQTYLPVIDSDSDEDQSEGWPADVDVDSWLEKEFGTTATTSIGSRVFKLDRLFAKSRPRADRIFLIR